MVSINAVYFLSLIAFYFYTYNQMLRKGLIRGIGLDVTDPEPLPPNHSLLSFENALIFHILEQQL